MADKDDHDDEASQRSRFVTRQAISVGVVGVGNRQGRGGGVCVAGSRDGSRRESSRAWWSVGRGEGSNIVRSAVGRRVDESSTWSIAAAKPVELNHVGPGLFGGHKLRRLEWVNFLRRDDKGCGQQGKRGDQPGLAFQSPIARIRQVGSWGSS